jgi:tetratricopeptide (TPR) repeat protein
MDDNLQRQIFNNLSLRETEDLLEIWNSRNPDEWDHSVFEIVETLLISRLGELPQQSILGNAKEILSSVDSYLRSGDLEKALHECERAIQLMPDLADAHNYRGVVYEEMGQPENAIINYQAAIQRDPEWDEAWENMLNVEKVLEEAFQESAARQHLDRALDYAYNDEPENAFEECELAKPILPRIAAAYNYLGMIYEVLEQFELAIDAYRDAIQLNLRDYAARDNLGNVWVRWEAEQYRLAASESHYELQETEETSADSGESEIPDEEEYGGPIPGWLYLDEKAFHLMGWAGHRNRPGRSGYDPLETQFEYAHMQGVIFRLLITGKFTPQIPVYLLLMTYTGIVYSLPFLIGLAGLFAGRWGMVFILIYFGPYWIIGIVILVNVFLSLRIANQDDYDDARLY